MPEHDPTRTDQLALYMRARAGEKAARDEGLGRPAKSDTIER
jgi:hypothetical protein